LRIKNRKISFIVLIIWSFIIISIAITFPSPKLSSMNNNSNIISTNSEFPQTLIPETQANYWTADYQMNPSVCALNATTFAVAWQSAGQDGDGWGIFAAVFSNTGTTLTSEFCVNTNRTWHQDTPSICRLSATTFVVVWESSWQDGSYEGVYATIFDSSGNNLTKEFRVNTYTESYQYSPCVSALNTTIFVVAWISTGQDGSGEGVYAKVFNSTGFNLTNDFRVNTYTTSHQKSPSVCTLNATAFIVAWDSNGQDGSSEGVYATVFDSTGSNLTQEFRVNTYTANRQVTPSVSALSNKTFVIAWDSYDQGGSGWGIYATVFDSKGARLTNEIRVNSKKSTIQESLSVCALSATTFVVTWIGLGQGGGDVDVYTTVFSRKGTRLMSEFCVNTYRTQDQSSPSICALNATIILVAWESWEQDGDCEGVFFKGFRMPAYGEIISIDIGLIVLLVIIVVGVSLLAVIIFRRKPKKDFSI
jgi:hypothetical protein